MEPGQIPTRSRRLDLGDRAQADLRFIRETMVRASAFAAVPGMGWIAMGVTAFLTALAASFSTSIESWLFIWLVEAGFASGIGSMFLFHKARRLGQSLETGAGSRFVVLLLPSLVAGAVLTLVFVQFGRTEYLPGLWLLTYGVANTSAGDRSVHLLAWAGVLFMILGALAFVTPTAWGDAWMALGFGGIHVAFGWQITRRFDG